MNFFTYFKSYNHFSFRKPYKGHSQLYSFYSNLTLHYPGYKLQLTDTCYKQNPTGFIHLLCFLSSLALSKKIIKGFNIFYLKLYFDSKIKLTKIIW